MDVRELLREFRDRYVYKVSGEGTVTGAAVSRIARAGVVRREELVEDLVKLEAERTGDDPGRVRERVGRVIRFVLHYLRSAGLVYAREHSRKSYIISTLWLLFVESVLGDKWVNWLMEVAPHISESELEELKRWVELSKASSSEVYRLSEEEQHLARKLARVRRFVERALVTAKHVGDLLLVVRDTLPDMCSIPPTELLVRSPKRARSLTVSEIIDGVGWWYLECYALLAFDYIPFLLRLLADLAYSYATMYSTLVSATSRTARGIAKTIKLDIYVRDEATKLWLEERCKGASCPSQLREMVSETVSRLTKLMVHLLQAPRGTIGEFIREYAEELKKSGKWKRETYQGVSITRKFLLETLGEFYMYMPLVILRIRDMEKR